MSRGASYAASASCAPIQPRAVAVLEYLVRHRDRVVETRELLDRLWPEVTVTAGSLHRAVTLARAAAGRDRIRAWRGVGYRFAGDDVDAGAAETAGFVPRFATSGGGHVAYHVLGEGSLDIVIIAGWVFPMRAFLEHAGLHASLREMSRLGRVILFDKRGTGLSDPVKRLPTLDERLEDLRAVLDATGSGEAVLVGLSEGGPLAVLHATTYPQRTRGLLLVDAFARWTRAPGKSRAGAPPRWWSCGTTSGRHGGRGAPSARSSRAGPVSRRRLLGPRGPNRRARARVLRWISSR